MPHVWLIRRPLRFLRKAFRSLRKVVRPSRYDKLKYEAVAKKMLGNQDLIALDVGAAAGLLPHWRKGMRGIARIYQIEPRAEACRELERENSLANVSESCVVVEAAISELGGRQTLYVSKEPTGTSLFPADLDRALEFSADYVRTPKFFPMQELEIETRTLAEIMDQAGEVRVDLVKLDIQGTELGGLKSLGQPRLRNLIGVELEVGLHGFYPDAPTFGDVERFMTDNGLILYDCRVHRNRMKHDGDPNYYPMEIFGVRSNSPSISARVWEFDAVFFRNGADLIERSDEAALRRLMVALCAYNYYVEAYVIAEKAMVSGVISPADGQDLQTCIIDAHMLKAYKFHYAPNKVYDFWRHAMGELAPVDARRWCQYIYHDYPSG
jgi:FkbM family methyltransferase